MQRQVQGMPSPMSEEEKDKTSPDERYNLENAFIYIDNKRYSVKEFLKLIVDKLLQPSTT